MTQDEAGGAAAALYVIRHQDGRWWSKGREWVERAEFRRVARYRYRDEAVNTLAELSTRDSELRGTVLAVTADGRGDPVLPGDAGDRSSAA
jgi:hypothetical protein